MCSLIYLAVWLFLDVLFRHTLIIVRWPGISVGLRTLRNKRKSSAKPFSLFQNFSSTYEAPLERAGLIAHPPGGYRKKMIVVEVYKSMHHLSAKFMWDMFQPKSTSYKLRPKNPLQVQTLRTVKYGKCTLTVHGAVLWNSLPGTATACNDMNTLLKHSLERWNWTHWFSARFVVFVFVVWFFVLFWGVGGCRFISPGG